MAPNHALFALGASMMLSHCGTNIEVGRNDQPTYMQKDDHLYTESDASLGNGDVVAATADGETVDCFATATEESMPESLAGFCEAPPNDDFGSAFAKAYDLLCQQRRFVHMTREGCGWDGNGSLDPYYKILERTELDDSSTQEFTFFSINSVQIERSKSEYLWAFYEGYRNPEFKKRIKSFDNVELSNVTVDEDAGKIDYHVEVTTSAAVAGFTGTIDLIEYPSGLVAIYDRALTDKVLVKENRYLILLAPIDEERLMVVAVDDKIIEDFGNHPIAYNNSIDLGKTRMETTVAMANYDEEVP